MRAKLVGYLRWIEANLAADPRQPLARFERDERSALRPLADVRPHHVRVVQRRVANDAYGDVDTVRYSVPYRLVHDRVEVWIDADAVRVLHGGV
jgi:hypothetical protein